ncbi:MAG: DNA repair protein RecN [Anaerolineaceae bacterium 4572_5.1]|nr:MAG: DNA repair protein RecN [Anaerolineaceae bacterium 4572_5.1]
MLVELKIKNFAIINELELEFKPGLVVFTGETGAGKSIIMGALSMLFGTRADMTDLRSGADWASVEAIFRIPDKVREVVDSLLVEEALSGGEEYLTLGRELRRDKQNVARVNGHRVSVSILVELGRYLIDIHGQSDHLSLMQVHQHKGLLDRYANVGKILKSYQETYQELQKVQRELDGLQKVEQDAARRSELLSYQLGEIEAANLIVGEDDELKYEHKRLANSEKLAELCQATLVILDDAPPDQPTVMELLGQTVSDIKNLASIDPSQASLDEKIQGLTEEIAEFGQDLRTYMETLEFDPAQLKKVEERLNLIRSLKRKYGQTIPEILEFAEKASAELETYVNSSTRIAELEILENKLLIELGQKGQRLTQQRKTGAEKMAAALEIELKDLRMDQARFRVDFIQSPDPDGVPVGEGRRLAYTRSGLEEIEFLIETNPGEGFKPLARVASGGETSRLMLALKQVLVKADSIFTLVFDEIDQGIGGRVGAIVGYKLRKLATQHQVICITHLPQLAGFGGQHLHVQKRIENGRTLTQVHPLTGEERVNELAQMLGGISEANKKSAQDILESSNQLIKSL